MSRLHDMAVDIGFEVDKFTNRIEEEKKRIKEAKARLDRQLAQRQEKESEALALEAELGRLQETCFSQSPADADDDAGTTMALCLANALGETRAAAQRMRDMRMEILAEYRTKLDQCELMHQRNTMLMGFLETWRRKQSEGKHLSELPDLVKKLSMEVSHFYSIPVHQILEKAFPDTAAGTKIDMIQQADSAPHSVPTTMSHLPRAGAPTETLCGTALMNSMLENCGRENAADVSALCRVRGEPEPSIYIADRTATEFSRLDNLHDDDTGLLGPTGRQGMLSEEALRKICTAQEDTILDPDATL